MPHTLLVGIRIATVERYTELAHMCMETAYGKGVSVVQTATGQIASITTIS